MITPAGGATNLGTFVSLLGSNQLNLAGLMDSQKSNSQRIRNIVESKKITSRPIILVDTFTQAGEADIEDRFEPGFYLSLVNGAFLT